MLGVQSRQSWGSSSRVPCSISLPGGAASLQGSAQQMRRAAWRLNHAEAFGLQLRFPLLDCGKERMQVAAMLRGQRILDSQTSASISSVIVHSSQKPVFSCLGRDDLAGDQLSCKADHLLSHRQHIQSLQGGQPPGGGSGIS